MPGVFDGLTDAVHDARVSTRRLRELLPLISERLRIVEDLEACFKRMGRALGRVRDKDVLIEVLGSLEARIPHAAPVVVVVRHRHERQRHALARELIRTLEKLQADRVLAKLSVKDRKAGSPYARALTDRSSWRQALGRTVRARAEAAATAIGHATGVYFPGRIHRARIALKQFRYSLEVAEGTGERTVAHALDDLKHVQDVLGDLHDRQILIEELLQDSASPEVVDQITVVTNAIEAENQKLHEKYLALRPRLLEICRQEAQPDASLSRSIAPFAAAGVVALSSLLVSGRRRAS